MKLRQNKNSPQPRPSLKSRLLRSGMGAGIAEYAIVVGLVAVASMGAVALTGERISELFGGVGNEVAESTTPPSITLSASSAAIGFAQSSEFTWEAQNASALDARYSLAGSCAEADESGSGPHPLGWSGMSGSQTLLWTQDLAGCSFDVEMTASNAAGRTGDSAAVMVGAADTTPENLAFAPKGGAEPGQLTASDPATVADVEADTTISAGISGGGAGVSLAGGTPQAQVTVAPGSQIQLHGHASDSFGQTVAIPFSAGAMSGTWQLTTRAADMSADPFTLGADDLGAVAGTHVESDGVTFTGFELPQTLTIAPLQVNPAAGTLQYRIFAGSWGVWTTLTASVEIPGVAAGAGAQLRLATAGTYPATAQTAEASISIGGQSDSWRGGIAAQDVTANAFSFTNVANATRSTSYDTAGDAVVLDGFTGTLPLTLARSGAGGAYQYRLGAGAWTAIPSGGTTVQVAPGTALRLNIVSASSYATAASITASIGGQSRSWTVTTGAAPLASCSGGVQVSWYSCSKSIPAGTYSQDTTVALSIPRPSGGMSGYYGNASFSCSSSGTWQFVSGTCSWQPRDKN